VISRSRKRENRKSKEKIGHQEEDRRGVANSSGLKQIKSALGAGKGERRREGMMGGHLYIEPSRGGGWTMEEAKGSGQEGPNPNGERICTVVGSTGHRTPLRPAS
jgi:hypothetical protein